PFSESAFRYPPPSMMSEVNTERNPPVTAAEQYSSYSHQQSSGGSERSNARGPSKGKGRVRGISIPKPPPPVLTVQQLASWAQLTHTSKWKFGSFNLGGSKDFPLSGHTYSSEESDLLNKMKERDHVRRTLGIFQIES